MAAGLGDLGLGGDVQFHAENSARHVLGLTLVGAVGREALEGRMPLADLPHDRPGFGSIGLVGGGDVHGQERALAVDGDVTRAALDLFAAVKAARLALCGALDALAVQDRVAGRAARAAQLHLAPAGAQHGDGLLPDAALLPALEMIMHRVIRRKVVRQRPPTAALAQPVQAGFDHAPLGVLLAGTTWIGPRKERRDLLPLRVAQVAGIAHPRSLPDADPTTQLL